MSSGAESLAGVDVDRHTIVGARRLAPAGNDEEALADRKTSVRLFPLFRPIVVFESAERDWRSGNIGAGKEGKNGSAYRRKIRALLKVGDDVRLARFWITLPGAGHAVFGQLAKDGVLQVVRDIKGDFFPGHGFYPLLIQDINISDSKS